MYSFVQARSQKSAMEAVAEAGGGAPRPILKKLMQLKRSIEISSAKTWIYKLHKWGIWEVAIVRISVVLKFQLLDLQAGKS